MVDRARLDRLLATLGTELDFLEQTAGRSGPDLLADPTALRAVKYAFVVAIESAIDAAQHVITAEGLRVPDSFADAFRVLRDAGLLDEGSADAMGDAARFRNLLVHGYADVDDERVLSILRSRPGDLRAYRRTIAAID